MSGLSMTKGCQDLLWDWVPLCPVEECLVGGRGTVLPTLDRGTRLWDPRVGFGNRKFFEKDSCDFLLLYRFVGSDE